MIRRMILAQIKDAHDIHVVDLLTVLRTMFFLLLLLVVAIPNSAHAQWSGEGVQLLSNMIGENADACPDGEGGFWYAQNRLDFTRILVQHVDSDGYRTFDLSGISVCDSIGGHLFGIEPGPDGDCIVMFSRTDTDGFQDLFAQRITQQGEWLWGGGGINISASDAERHKDPISYNDQWTESDGNGGLWGIWGRGTIYYHDINICGVNADGSLKRPVNDYRVVNWSMDSDAIRYTSDGAGGLVVTFAWNDDDWENSNREIYVQRILANGSPLYPDPVLILDWPTPEQGGYYDPFFIVKDPQGGFVVTSLNHWQRLSGALQPQWDLQGVYAINWGEFWRESTSNPVIMADRSVQQLVSGFLLGYQDETKGPYLAQMSFEGEPGAVGELGPWAGDSLYGATGHGGLVFDLPAPDRQSVIYTFYTNNNGQGTLPHCVFERINSSGENLWTHVPYLADGRFRSPVNVFYIDNDNICYVIPIWNNVRISYAFKVNIHDGSIAGDTSVEEWDVNPSTLPAEPILISNSYPNPFNGSVTVELKVSLPGTYELILVNTLGQLVSQHALSYSTVGVKQFTFTAPDNSSSGVYFLALSQQSRLFGWRKVLLLQ